jgi:hypothetical protein
MGPFLLAERAGQFEPSGSTTRESLLRWRLTLSGAADQGYDGHHIPLSPPSYFLSNLYLERICLASLSTHTITHATNLDGSAVADEK